MIKIKENIDKFNAVLSIIKGMSEETDFQFTSDGVKVKGIHPSGFCMVDVNIGKDFFDEYKVDKDTILTLKNELFYKIVKKVGKKELLVEILEDRVAFSSNKDSFELKYFVGKEDERVKPDLKHPIKLEIKSGVLFKQISDLADFSTLVNLVFKDNKFNVISKGNMVKGSTIIDILKYEGIDSNCWYDAEYLSLFKDIEKLGEKICISFGEKLPVQVNLEEDSLTVDCILAPRMEEDPNE